MANSLLPDKVKIPIFHLLPKIHKPDNPRRPLMSSVDCHSSRISEFVNHFLQTAVTKLKSYAKDATDLIKDRNVNNVTDDTYLVLLDV